MTSAAHVPDIPDVSELANLGLVELSRRLVGIAEASPWFMEALQAVARLGLASEWCIGAGAVRNLVWDRMHGFEQPSSLADVDVAFFDPSDLFPEADRRLLQALRAQRPDIPWEVTNQASVHLWFASYFGHAIQPHPSLEAAVASWPEFATCVGVTVNSSGELRVIAPHGLDDLFAIVIRRNPAVGVDTYRQRVETKRYAERWPRVRVIPA